MTRFFLHIKPFSFHKNEWLQQKNYFLKILIPIFLEESVKMYVPKISIWDPLQTIPCPQILVQRCPKTSSKDLENQSNIWQISFSSRNNVKIEWHLLKSLETLLSKKVSPNKKQLFILPYEYVWVQFNLLEVSLNAFLKGKKDRKVENQVQGRKTLRI